MAAKKLIELRGRLPRYDHQDADFVVQELPKHQPCTIAEFVTELGFDPRPAGSPGREYQRLRAAFHVAEIKGRIERYMGGRRWVLPGFGAEKSA